MLILKPLTIDWSVAGADIPAVTFIAQTGLPARELAHMLDSLVRVSRRVGWNHLVIVVRSGIAPRNLAFYSGARKRLCREAQSSKTLQPNAVEPFSR